MCSNIRYDGESSDILETQYVDIQSYFIRYFLYYPYLNPNPDINMKTNTISDPFSYPQVEAIGHRRPPHGPDCRQNRDATPRIRRRQRQTGCEAAKKQNHARAPPPRAAAPLIKTSSTCRRLHSD
jgi:hypothetical protein